nr:EFR1 family ferrodoxin [uncultured Agathobaculum sp.]
MVVYFSGTGNSRYCAEMIADELGDSLTDVFPHIRARQAAELQSDRPWVFVAPTYGWQLPHIFAEFVQRSNFSGSRKAYFVLTCGSEIGCAGSGIAKLCKEKSFEYKGVLQVVMPENYIVLFRAPGQAQAQKIIEAARPDIESGIACIRRGESFPPHKTGVVDWLKSNPVNAMLYRFTIRAAPFYATDACIGCGKCAADCVLHNIRLENGKPAWGADCTHCMACICGCPVHAIEYGKATRKKVRYQCPPYQKK